MNFPDIDEIPFLGDEQYYVYQRSIIPWKTYSSKCNLSRNKALMFTEEGISFPNPVNKSIIYTALAFCAAILWVFRVDIYCSARI